jgi:hypothetical protein
MATDRNGSRPRKRELLELLQTQIKFGKIPEAEREKFMADETEKRINAALELYDIEPNTPAEAKWCALAMYLLGAHFRGCRSLARQPGGAPKNSRPEVFAELTAFDEYYKAARPATDMTHATNFLKGRNGKIQVGNETITTAKGLLNLHRREKKVAS